MISIVVLFTLIVSAMAQKDNSVFVQVSASGTSEHVVVNQQAIASAVSAAEAEIKKAGCKDVEAIAQAQAIKIVNAAATATAESTIVIQTRGDGQGVGSSKVDAVSAATAIAEAIAKAIAQAASGAAATAQSEALVKVTQEARATVEQLVISSGDAQGVVRALAASTAFVRAVAEALAESFSDCETAAVNVAAAAQEIPAPTDIQFADTFADVEAFGNGGAIAVLQNNALAETLPSFTNTFVPDSDDSDKTPSGPKPAPKVPTPSGGVAIASSNLFPQGFRNIGFLNKIGK